MKHLKRILIVFTGGLIAFSTIAADAPDRPLHVLYVGSVAEVGSAALAGRARIMFICPSPNKPGVRYPSVMVWPEV